MSAINPKLYEAISYPVEVEHVRKPQNFRVSLERNLGIDWEHEQNSNEQPPESMQTNEILDNCSELRNSPSASQSQAFNLSSELKNEVDAYKNQKDKSCRGNSFGSSQDM